MISSHAFQSSIVIGWEPTDVAAAAQRAACAVDMMSVRLSDIHKLPAASLAISEVVVPQEEEV